ncbi:hypothetical protein DYB30_001136 [Aphanomyces astaci]|uniref:Kinesin motor domain-containing protein n=1 Tax=Aphanomyces astaci TaxID=112090 RepID=A0A397E347_APHAT|nr:hypothetical protein DYB30_001136 [Aphanomyces astaci]RHY73353.1 hypothetical protein DYB34_000502 [Aphanomyces astaci]RHY90242.1 hypothetical protein DYB26_000324 [Aphanomyces astaci]RHZ13552.1 hypothetical protein DYB31_000648 [Aphanomyces astaci]
MPGWIVILFISSSRQRLKSLTGCTPFRSVHSTGSAKDEPRFDYERENLEIHEDAQGMVYVKDLSMIEVSNREEVRRSGSDCSFGCQVDVALGQVMCGMMNLVDLAGYTHTHLQLQFWQKRMRFFTTCTRSERLKKSESDGQRLKEALHINSSLSAVGKVVMSLDPESGFNYIPYRDSKLTRLLQNSIGGNSYTLLIATIHPMKEHYEECLNTMQFANRCRMVQNQPRVNYISQSGGDKDKRIRKLLEEIAMLNRKLEHIKNEQNQRMSNVLRELGYDVSEYTAEGNVRLKVELKREKDELQRQLQQHKKEIARLEGVVLEKDVALDRIQAMGNSKHKEEIRHLLAHSHELNKHLHVQFHDAKPAAFTASSVQQSEQLLHAQFHQRALALEKGKQDDIALVKTQYECLLTRKRAECDELTKIWSDKLAQSTHLCDTLKQEMADLYVYASRLFDAAQGPPHRGHDVLPWPKAILTNPNKLRAFKALLGSDPAVRARVTCDKKPPPLKGAPTSPTSRPVSAPVRRPMSAGFATALRGRVVRQAEETYTERPDHDDDRGQLVRQTLLKLFSANGGVLIEFGRTS